MRRFLIGAAAVSIFFVTLTSDLFAQSKVNWTENGKFAEFLLHSRDVLGVETFHVDHGRPWLSSSCNATILRPDRLAGPTQNPENLFWCEVVYSPHEKGMMLWRAGSAGFEAWGNRYDKYPFQVMDQPTATILFEAIRDLVLADPENPWYSKSDICGPDGSCNESFAILRKPEYLSVASFICSRDFMGPETLKTRCVFLKFD